MSALSADSTSGLWMLSALNSANSASGGAHVVNRGGGGGGGGGGAIQSRRGGGHGPPCPPPPPLHGDAHGHVSTRLHFAGQHLHLLSFELSSAPLPPVAFSTRIRIVPLCPRLIQARTYENYQCRLPNLLPAVKILSKGWGRGG